MKDNAACGEAAGPCDIGCAGACVYVGANAGYCETNWTSLDSANCCEQCIEYAPTGYEFIEYQPRAHAPINTEQTNLNYSESEFTKNAVVQKLSADDEEIVRVKSEHAGRVHSDRLHKDSTVECLRRGHPQYRGKSVVNPRFSSEQSAGKQLERWQRRS